MSTLLEVLGLVLLILLVVALWFVFRGDPSLIDCSAWCRSERTKACN